MNKTILQAIPAVLVVLATCSGAGLTNLWTFTGLESSPNGLVMHNGSAYGTTPGSGTAGFGTVFELTPPTSPGGARTKTVLYNFTGGSDGSTPIGNVVFDENGALYGVTYSGGPKRKSGLGGTVYRLTPPTATGGAWTHSVIYAYPGDLNSGNFLNAGLTWWNGSLYGTSTSTLFQLSPPASSGGAWTRTALYH